MTPQERTERIQSLEANRQKAQETIAACDRELYDLRSGLTPEYLTLAKQKQKAGLSRDDAYAAALNQQTEDQKRK